MTASIESRGRRDLYFTCIFDFNLQDLDLDCYFELDITRCRVFEWQVDEPVLNNLIYGCWIGK